MSSGTYTVATTGTTPNDHWRSRAGWLHAHISTGDATHTKHDQFDADGNTGSPGALSVAERAKADFAEVAGQLGLTPLQARTVLWLEQPSAMGGLAEHLSCDASNVTGLADRLETHGLFPASIREPAGHATIPLMAVVTQEYVDVPVGDLAMRTFVAAPRSPGPHPAIVFYSDIFQLTEPTLRWCVRLASYGFLVAAPEIYHRIEPSGTVLEFDDEGKARGQRDAETTPVGHFDADAAAALDWLEERTGGAPLGAAGHCTGGHIAFRAAFDPRVRSTACWYPTGLHDGKLAAEPDAATLARAPEIKGDLLLIFGTRDPHTPEAGRQVVRRGVRDNNVTWLEYDAEHAFGRDIGPRYDPEITDEAFAQTVAHLRRTLA